MCDRLSTYPIGYEEFLDGFTSRLEVQLDFLTNFMLSPESLFCPNIFINRKSGKLKVDRSRAIEIPIAVGDLCIRSYFGWTVYNKPEFRFDQTVSNENYMNGLAFVLIPKIKYRKIVKTTISNERAGSKYVCYQNHPNSRIERYMLFEEMAYLFSCRNADLLDAYYNAYRISYHNQLSPRWDDSVVYDTLLNYGFSFNQTTSQFLKMVRKLKTDADDIWN